MVSSIKSIFGGFSIPIMITLVILISGCVGQTPEEVSTVGSVDGVAVGFFQGAPPTTIGEGENFDVVVSLENMGDYEVPAGRSTVHLRGINPLSFSMSPHDSRKNIGSDLIIAQVIEGQTIGGLEQMSWSSLCYAVDLNTDQTVEIITQSCYDYQTESRAEACFNQNAYAQDTGAETCSVLGSKEVTNSKAPLKVDSLIESPAGQEKFRFIVKVSNLGGGTVYDKLNMDSTDINNKSYIGCPSASLQDLNLVYIESIKVGSAELNLLGDAKVTSKTWFLDGSNNAYIKLIDGKGQFMFTYKPDFVVSVFSDPVEIKLGYGYSDRANSFVSISSIPGVTPSCTAVPQCYNGLDDDDDELIDFVDDPGCTDADDDDESA